MHDFLSNAIAPVLIFVLFIVALFQRLHIERQTRRISTLTDIVTDVSRRTNNTTAKLMLIENRLNMETLRLHASVTETEVESTHEH